MDWNDIDPEKAAREILDELDAEAKAKANAARRIAAMRGEDAETNRATAQATLAAIKAGAIPPSGEAAAGDDAEPDAEAKADDTASGEEEAKADPPMHSFRDAVEIAQMAVAAAVQVWGGLLKDPGAICEIIGEPGLGKSRLILIVAICQILGIPFPNEKWPLYAEPLTWLFFGTENSLRRWNHDLKMIFKRLTAAQIERIRGRLILPTLEADDDTDMELTGDGADKNIEKLKNAVRKYNPNVTVWDPYGDLLEDELDDGEIKKALRIIKRIIRAGKDPAAVAYVLNHSKMGIKQIASARGGDAGNFGRNSKKIYGGVRCVINLRTTNYSGNHGEGIELIHAKHNDTAELPLAAVKLCPDMWYEDDPDFDHDSYQAELDRLAGNKTATESKIEKPRTLTREEVAEYWPKLAADLCGRPLPTASGKVITQIRAEMKTTKTCAEYVIDQMTVEDRDGNTASGLYVWERKQPKANFITTESQQAAQMKLDAEAVAERKAKRKAGRGGE